MNVWLTGYFGRDNIGDEAILAATLRHLPAPARARVLTPAPARSRALHDAPCLHCPPLDIRRGRFSLRHGWGYWLKHGWAMLGERFTDKACIMAAGGSLNDHVPDRVVTLGRQVDALRAFGCRVALLAVGADPIRRPADAQAAADIINHRVAYCSVRDQQSADALAQAGADPARIHVASDAVFALTEPDASLPAATGDLAQARVGCNLRPLFSGADASAYRVRAAELIGQIVPRVGRLTLVPFSPEDHHLLGELAADHGVDVWPFDPHPGRTLRRIRELDFLIAMRYHACVFAVLRGVPCLPLPYAPKVHRLAQALQLDCPELIVGDGEEMPSRLFAAEAVVAALDDLWTQRRRLQQRFRAYHGEQYDIARADMCRCWQALALAPVPDSQPTLTRPLPGPETRIES